MRARALLFDGPLEIQTQVGMIIVITISNNEDNGDDDNKGWEEVTKITKINAARVIR